MPSRKSLTLKIFFFLVLIDLAETLAQFCFKKSVANVNFFEIHGFVDSFNFVRNVIPSPFLWIGLFSVIFIFISWSTVLSRIDLSVAVPVCSFSYITIPVVSMIFFHENVSLVRWFGISLILVGVILVSISSVKKGKPQ